MPRSAFRFAAGKADVDGSDLVNGETLADRLDFAERLEHSRQISGGNAEDLHVDLSSVDAQKAIADPAADDERAAAALAHRVRDFGQP